MIVCLCRNVSDRTISAALEAGAKGLDGIAGATGAGTDCGCCIETLQALAAHGGPCTSPPCPGCARADRPGKAA